MLETGSGEAVILDEGDGGELLAELIDDEDRLEQQEFFGAAHVLLLPGAAPALVSQQPPPEVAFVTTSVSLAVVTNCVIMSVKKNLLVCLSYHSFFFYSCLFLVCKKSCQLDCCVTTYAGSLVVWSQPVPARQFCHDLSQPCRFLQLVSA